MLPDAPKPFSSENQPTSEEKRQGWAKKKRGRELIEHILNLTFKGHPKSEIRKQMAEYFGVPESQITIEQVMLFRQAEKAIQKGDTAAFNAIMDSYTPKLARTELTGKDGEDFNTIRVIYEDSHQTTSPEPTGDSKSIPEV